MKEKHLYFRGEPERFDRKRLMKEVEDCRRDGFTLELGETRPWLNTVASPVFDLSGSTIGYIVIIGLFSA